MRIINKKQGFSTETLMHYYWNDVKDIADINKVNVIVFNAQHIDIISVNDDVIAQVNYLDIETYKNESELYHG